MTENQKYWPFNKRENPSEFVFSNQSIYSFSAQELLKCNLIKLRKDEALVCFHWFTLVETI